MKLARFSVALGVAGLLTASVVSLEHIYQTLQIRSKREAVAKALRERLN